METLNQVNNLIESFNWSLWAIIFLLAWLVIALGISWLFGGMAKHGGKR